MVETLGKRLVAVILERHVRTVTPRVAGEGSPDDAEQKRIIDTLQIVQILAGNPSSVVRAWFIGDDPQLDDESPPVAPSQSSNRAPMKPPGIFAGTRA